DAFSPTQEEQQPGIQKRQQAQDQTGHGGPPPSRQRRAPRGQAPAQAQAPGQRQGQHRQPDRGRPGRVHAFVLQQRQGSGRQSEEDAGASQGDQPQRQLVDAFPGAPRPRYA